MTTEFQVSLDEGKYTYERDDDGQQRALRYGEPWRDLVGDKFVAAMGYEIERLQELLIDDSRLRDDLIKAEKEIERLRKEVECLQLTIKGFRSGIAAAQAQVEKLKDELTATQKSLMGAMTHIGEVSQYAAKLQWDLKASQAREAKLRRWIATSPVVITHDDEIAMAKERKREILAMSTDDTTLNERLAQERERIAERFEQLESPWITKEAASALVRNLGGEA